MPGLLPLPHARVPVSAVPPLQVIDELGPLVVRQPQSTIVVVRLQYGTTVGLSSQGFFRQPWTKSDAGYRRGVLPRFAVGMLMARKLTAADNPHDAIFASRRGT
ncbi:hypothetical protein GA0070562_5143 [Micromonospora tulbaghiae]|uniref:Uncharacterized protein n=1 Tax=Micromonospora tulbaghiae TaxID=479978 RepID=A0ABY0KQT9_9ACTN|nr:hypothetical protein GA0070562_5143 [Micromonospora tulbaghiae]